MASNILNSYIPKFLINLNRDNEDIIKVNTRYFSPEGDVYELDKRTIAPVVIQTQESLNELRIETSSVYPVRIVAPLDFDGAVLIEVPSIETVPTASQSYFMPIYFERYSPEVIRNLDRNFVELTTPVDELFLSELTTTL